MKNKRGSAWIWILIILILITAGIGIYFLFFSGDGSIDTSSLNLSTPEKTLLEHINAVKTKDVDKVVSLLNEQERPLYKDTVTVESLEIPRKIYYGENGEELEVNITSISYLSGSGGGPGREHIVYPEGRVVFVRFTIGDKGAAFTMIKEKGNWMMAENPASYDFNK